MATKTKNIEIKLVIDDKEMFKNDEFKGPGEGARISNIKKYEKKLDTYLTQTDQLKKNCKVTNMSI